jgi:hypothetical protein
VRGSERYLGRYGLVRHARQLVSLFALSFLLVGATQPQVGVRRVLLSVEGVSIPARSAIFRYRIDTFGVEFLAVCSLPPSWEIQSEKFENPEGYLSGRADIHGVPLGALKEMYLVDVYSYRAVASKDHPASFSGWVDVGTRERFGDWHGKRVPLRASNFRFKDAQRCPLSPPPQP